MSDVFRAITELPALTGVTADKKHILQSSALSNARVVFVFDGLNTKNNELQTDFFKFLVELERYTENLKMITILHNIERVPGEVISNFD